jgi:hypothetical protein
MTLLRQLLQCRQQSVGTLHDGIFLLRGVRTALACFADNKRATAMTATNPLS